MGNSIFILLLLQGVLILLNAIFASAEIAVLSLNETKLERLASQGNHKAKRLENLIKEPARFLATIQVAITLSGFLGSAFAADNFSEPLVNWVIGIGVQIPRKTLDTIAVLLITLILSYFTLIFGELVPKQIAMKKSEQLAMGISGLVSGISVIFKPIVWFLSVSTNFVLRLCGIDPNEAEEDVSEEDIRILVDAGSKKGVIERQEKEFIHNVFEFNDITASEIATRRTDVTFLWLADDIHVWDRTIHNSRHTFYPICDGSYDNVVGILNAKDYFRLADKTQENVLASSVYPAYFVPETIKADFLFRNLKKSKCPMAIVLDEYGGMIGIVTLNDLLEELVGELNDESSESKERKPYAEQIGTNIWKVFGNINLNDLGKIIDVDLSFPNYDTLTGLVFDILGMIPNEGEQNIDLEVKNLIIHIDFVSDHQIEQCTITVK